MNTRAPSIPNPCMLTLKAGRSSPLRGLAASGWHTASVLMRLWPMTAGSTTSGRSAAPESTEPNGPRALMAEKAIRGEGRILALRVSRKRPHIGLAQIGLSLRETATGDEVIRAVWWLMVERSRMSALESPAADRGTPKPAMPAPPERDAAVAPGVQMLYLGGTEPGKPIYLGEATVSEEEILTFARAFDPQPFHLDRKFAEASVLQGLAASGWHTCSLWMRTNVRARLGLLADMPESERQRFVHSAAIGLGFENLSWPRPVRPGDRLHAFMTLLEVAGKPIPARLGNRPLAIRHDRWKRKPGPPLPPVNADAETLTGDAVPFHRGCGRIMISALECGGPGRI